MTVITGNRQLAARARDLASQASCGSIERAACLRAAVALDESRSAGGARKICGDVDELDIRRALRHRRPHESRWLTCGNARIP